MGMASGQTHVLHLAEDKRRRMLRFTGAWKDASSASYRENHFLSDDEITREGEIKDSVVFASNVSFQSGAFTQPRKSTFQFSLIVSLEPWLSPGFLLKSTELGKFFPDLPKHSHHEGALAMCVLHPSHNSDVLGLKTNVKR